MDNLKEVPFECKQVYTPEEYFYNKDKDQYIIGFETGHTQWQTIVGILITKEGVHQIVVPSEAHAKDAYIECEREDFERWCKSDFGKGDWCSVNGNEQPCFVQSCNHQEQTCVVIFPTGGSAKYDMSFLKKSSREEAEKYMIELLDKCQEDK